MHDFLKYPISIQDFLDSEALLIRLNCQCYPDMKACEILSRAKNYLTNQFDRAPLAYILTGEFEDAGRSTLDYDPKATL